MTGRNKVLVLGGSSYIGRHLVSKLGNHRALGTYFRRPADHCVYFDCLSTSLSDVVHRPEAISHAVILLGDTVPDSCAADVEKSRALNVHAIKSILQQLKRWHIKPIFTSSEYVFDGAKGDYQESDEANPILTYGRQKIEVETYLQSQFEEFVILRLGKVFGSQPGDGTLFTNWLDAIARRETIRCAYDQVFAPIYIDDVVQGVLRIIDGDLNGLYHLAGHTSLSRIEFLDVLLLHVKSKTAQETDVVPMSINDFKLRETMPLNTSMRPDKLVNQTGLEIGEVDAFCRRLVDTQFDE